MLIQMTSIIICFAGKHRKVSRIRRREAHSGRRDCFLFKFFLLLLFFRVIIVILFENRTRD